MSEVIQPAAGQTVITTDNHHRDHGRHHDDHGFRETRLDADYRSLVAQAERFGTITGDRVREVGTAAALAASTTDSRVGVGFAGVGREICESTKDVTGAVTNASAASALAACKTVDEVRAVYEHLQKQVSDAATAVVSYAKDAQATAYQIEGRQALDAAKGFAAVGLKQTTDYNGLTVLGERIRAELGAKTDAGFSASALLSSQSLAMILAAIEKCCCDASKERAANQAATMAAITASFTAITGTVTAGFGALNNKLDQNTIDDLRAFKASIPRGLPVTIPVGVA